MAVGVYPYALLVPFYAARWYMSLSALLAACILFATLKILRSDRSSRWTGYGLLWGFELMTNAAFASIVPFLLVWLALRLRAARRAWIRLPGLAPAALVPVCAPWTIRNYAVFHTWVPLRPNFGFELWRFNNPPDRCIPPAIPRSWRCTSALERPLITAKKRQKPSGLSERIPARSL